MANIIERWDLIKLENLLDFYIGGDWGEQEPINSNYIATKVLRATDISNWENDHGENAQIRYLKDNSLAKRQLKENDLIIEVSGGSPDQPVGRTIIISSDDIQKFQYPVTCSNFFRLLRFNNKINPKFINYYFKFLYETKIIESYQSNSTNLRNLKFSQFLNQNIPVPQSLGEQQEIVDVLDAASEIIRLRTACIESAQSIIPALFQEMFGDPINNNKNWPIVKIDTVTNVISGGTPSTKIPEYWDGDIVWLTPKDLSGYNSVYISKGERNITDLGYKKSSAQIMPKGSVLFTSRAPIGYVAIADTDLCTNQGFKSFVPSMDIKSEYLYQLLKMMKPKILNIASGAVFKEISGSKIKELKIPLPNIELQNQFATKVQEIEEYIKSQQAELENAKTMFQSLLHHAFTGELTRRAYGE